MRRSSFTSVARRATIAVAQHADMTVGRNIQSGERMRVVSVMGAAVCATLSVGCAPQVNETNFAASREAMIGSPALYQKTITTCVAKPVNPKMLDELGALANLPADRARAVICERFVKAMRDGKFSYEQYVLSLKGTTTPEMIRIAQGR
ncbi:hypothetical protein [Hansschlegelia sp. KR7-227]|uniref:hypothetical protein n=1 Tax=Hansschlegelia sp. KR7-227 TaxID=3400914 RepID=UPI003C008038